MKAITIEHLAPYLPYGLKILREGKIVQLCGLSSPYKTNSNYYINGETKAVNGTHRTLLSFCVDGKHADSFKPLFRPISDLFNDRLRPVPINELQLIYGWDYLFYNVYKKKEPFNVMALQYGCLQKLFEHKFDVFGLIQQGLAVDINTIKP